MKHKLSLILFLITFFIISALVFFYNKTIDFPTLLRAIIVGLSAGAVAYIFGILIRKTLETSKSETSVLNVKTQQQYIDDLILSPEQILNPNFSEKNTKDDKK